MATYFSVASGTPGEMTTGIIEVEGLSKRYPPDIMAVDGISLRVEEGTVFSLLGPNGAGKTTTVEILEGLRTPTAGRVSVLGTDISQGYSPIRRRVGVLPQNFEPFDLLSPLEAVVYWADLLEVRMGRKDARRLLELVGLDERAKVMSKNLSGGEKRKLGIALSMVNDPELLFLDEPTTGLDPRARRDLWKLVEDTKRRGTTVVLTTHYLDEAERLADDVAIMHRGKVIAEGPPDELVSRHGHGTAIVLVGAGAEGLRELARRGIEASERDGDVVVPVADPAELRNMFAELSSVEVGFTEMYTRRQTLEDVFLELVGSTMDEGVLRG